MDLFKRKKSQRGVILIIVAAMMASILGFTALSVDIGYLYVVRNQLQNAADAAALQHAAYLYPSDSDGNPNWKLYSQDGAIKVLVNEVDHAKVTDLEIETGYWDLTGANSDLKSPSDSGVPGPNDAAAVKVTLSKSSGKNGGPVNLFFGPVIGVSTQDITVEAIAAVGYPNSVNEGVLLPIALSEGVYNEYWDFSNNTPKIDPDTGEPYVVKIEQDGKNGMWTSFDTYENSAKTIKDYMENGNPLPLEIGSMVWIVPGVKTSVYNYVPTNVDIFAAIVSDTTQKTETPILGFGAFHIEVAVGKNKKYIEGHFIKDQLIPGSGAGGPNYGAYTTPKLVR